MNKMLLIFAKEVRVMFRDRRLVIGVAVTSLIVMPAMMGLIGNMDRGIGSAETPVHVLVETPDTTLVALLSTWSDLRLYRERRIVEAVTSQHLTVRRRGTVYQILVDGTNRRLVAKAQVIQDALERERRKLIDEALALRAVRMSEIDPFTAEIVDIADPQTRSAHLLGSLVPYLVIILLVSSAIRALYVAVGEKEKNTLASLLVSNVARRSIVIGKTLAIVVFTFFSSTLLVAGLIIFASLGFTIDENVRAVSFSLTPMRVGEIAVNVLALALFIASIIMLVGTFARTQREAGIYTSPLLFISVILAVFSLSSASFGVGSYAVPILGNSLAMKDSFLGELTPGNLLLVVGSNLLLFAALVHLSVRLYQRESVLFRP